MAAADNKRIIAEAFDGIPADPRAFPGAKADNIGWIIWASPACRGGAD